MQLNPRIQKHLAQYEPQRLKAMLLWYYGQSTVNDRPAPEALFNVDASECYRLLDEQLNPEGMVRVTLLHEFGPDFMEKPIAETLNRLVVRRITGASQVA